MNIFFLFNHFLLWKKYRKNHLSSWKFYKKYKKYKSNKFNSKIIEIIIVIALNYTNSKIFLIDKC